MPIIISKNGRDAKRIDSMKIEKEDYLQRYIVNNPDVIPLYEIEEDLELKTLVREFPVGSGYIDILGMDQLGNMYIIETKLYKNQDKRKVIAQILDYGASLWYGYNTFDEFSEEIEKRINDSLEKRLREDYNLNDGEISELTDNLKNNFENGMFNFVVLMDRLPQDLKDLISYINKNSKFSIYAVELEYYKYEDYEITIPKLYGIEAKKSVEVGKSGRKRWNEQTFFEDAKARLNDEYYKAVEKLYKFSKDNADTIDFGTGSIRGSFNPKYYKLAKRSLYSVFSNGELSLNFGWLNDNPTIERYRDLFREKLSAIKTINDKIPSDYKNEFIRISISEWAPYVDKFISVIQELNSEDTE